MQASVLKEHAEWYNTDANFEKAVRLAMATKRDVLTGAQAEGSRLSMNAETIDLTDWSLADPGRMAKFSSWLRKGPAVVSITIGETLLRIDELCGKKAVRKIEFSNKLDISSGIIIAKCIVGNAHLHELKIQDRTLNVKNLSGEEPVESLSFSHQDLDTASVVIIASLLSSNMATTLLDLQGNRLENNGVLYLADALRENARLTSLSLVDTSIEFEQGQRIAQMLE
eukprot:3417751-Prymnesium_polylepis.1